MPKPDGSELKIELLRDEQWVLENWQPVFSVPQPDAASAAHHSENPASADDELTGHFGQFALRPVRLSSARLTPWSPIYQEFILASLSAEQADCELAGATVQMDLHELAITGPALITGIHPCPSIQTGDGRVVTATFHHSSGDVIDLVVGDAYSPQASDGALASGVEGAEQRLGGSTSLSETIGTTGNHPFWSVDRQAYVQAGSLEIGERLLTLQGDTKCVVTKLARPGPKPVFNLEVHGEHVYYVGQQGLLVHNTYAPNRTGLSSAQKTQVRSLVDDGFPARSAIRHVKGQDVRAFDVLPYKVGRFTTDLPGHEVLNNRFLELRGLSPGRGVGVNSTRNAAIALPRQLHSSTIQKLQRKHGVWFARDLKDLTRTQVIRKNLDVLREAGVGETTVQEIRRAALIHARRVGRGN